MIDDIANNDDEITFKELVLKFKEWFLFIKSKWKLLFLVGLIGGSIGFIYASTQKVRYTAKMTFVLEEGKASSSGLGGLASLAGQFGVDLSSNSSGGVLSGDNILLYFKTTSLAREVLLSKFDSLGHKSIADEYAIVYDLTESWSKNKKIGKINFPVINNNTSYNRLQDSLLQEIIKDILSNKFDVTRKDKKAGFIDVTVTMQSEILAKLYCERIVQKVVERYINMKTQRQNATVEKLQLRVDSISNLLRQKTLKGATLQNSSTTMDINPLYRTGTSVAVESTIRDKTLLSTIFASVTQNLEVAKFTLSQETPVIQIVDSPILPLKKQKQSRLFMALLGSFILTFGFILILILKKIYDRLIFS